MKSGICKSQRSIKKKLLEKPLQQPESRYHPQHKRMQNPYSCADSKNTSLFSRGWGRIDTGSAGVSSSGFARAETANSGRKHSCQSHSAGTALLWEVTPQFSVSHCPWGAHRQREQLPAWDSGMCREQPFKIQYTEADSPSSRRKTQAGARLSKLDAR